MTAVHVQFIVASKAWRQHVLSAEQVVVVKDDGVDIDGQLVLPLRLHRPVDEAAIEFIQVCLKQESKLFKYAQNKNQTYSSMPKTSIQIIQVCLKWQHAVSKYATRKKT